MREFIETLELSVGVCLRSSKDVTQRAQRKGGGKSEKAGRFTAEKQSAQRKAKAKPPA
jgi:hypothetical protein